MTTMGTITEAASLLGVSAQTLRRWERDGKIRPERTPGGQRRYNLDTLRHIDIGRSGPKPTADRPTVAYTRVSSNDQKADLARQREMLGLFCAARGWTYEIVDDLGSGLNYRKPGLRGLIKRIVAGEIGRLVLTHEDRLLRFGAEIVFALCEMKGVEVVVINHGDETTFEQDLANDVLEIVTVFSARLYGSRSHKNRQLIESFRTAAAALTGAAREQKP
jgi:putative resolvase